MNLEIVYKNVQKKNKPVQQLY